MMALCTLPDLLNDEKFPADVKERVERILSCCKGGSVGKNISFLFNDSLTE